MRPALRPGAAVREAIRLGLVRDSPALEINPAWWSTWWAFTEVGWLTDDLVQVLPGSGVVLGQVDRLRRAGWASRSRRAGRPAAAVRRTRAGAAALAEITAGAPAWTASSREVSRRAVAVVLAGGSALSGPTVVADAVEIAAGWHRLVRPGDVREVLAEWKRVRWLTTGAVPEGRWQLTELGFRACRALATAVRAPLPRRPRRQDEDHDQLLLAGLRRALARWPELVPVLRLARRCPVPGAEGHGWILPDAAAGFRTQRGTALLVVEAERHGRYDGLLRHAERVRRLAAQHPHDEVLLAVLCRHHSPGRVAAIEDVLAAPSTPNNLRAAVTTPDLLLARLDDWGVDEHARPAAPRW